MDTKITVTVTVERGFNAPEVFSTSHEANCPSANEAWPSVITGLENTMSTIHRQWFPTPEEQAEEDPK